MKKAIIIAALLILASTAQAQILNMDGEESNRAAGDLEELGRIPTHNVDYDQYNAIAPVGEGVLLLGVLGGAYLLGSRRRERGRQDQTRSQTLAGI